MGNGVLLALVVLETDDLEMGEGAVLREQGVDLRLGVLLREPANAKHVVGAVHRLNFY